MENGVVFAAIHDEKLERLSRRVLLRANLPGVLTGLFVCVAVEVLVCLLSEGIGRWVAGAGLLLVLLVLITTTAIRAGVDKGKLHGHGSDNSWATVAVFGAKGIKLLQFSCPKGSVAEEIIALSQKGNKRDFNQVPYEKVRQVWERDGVLFLIHGFLEQPIPLDGRFCDLEVARRLIRERATKARWRNAARGGRGPG